MSDFERQLQDELRSAAAGVSPRHTHVGEILTEGARRAKRRQAQKAIGGVLFAGIAVVGGVAVLTRDDGTTRVAIGNESADSTGEPTDREDPVPGTAPVPTGDGSAVIVDSNLTWRSVDVDSTEALSLYTYGLSDYDAAPFFELSTQPGRTNDYAPVVWTSDDGVSWTTTGSSSPITIRDVTSVGSSIYAVGTGPATAASASGTKGELSLSISPDSGETWKSAPIPLDLKTIEDHPGIGKMNAQVLVTDGPEGVLVVVRPWTTPDLSDVPDYDPSAGWSVQRDGIGLYTTDSLAQCQDMAVAATTPVSTDETVSTDPVVETTSICAPTIARVIPWSELDVAAEDLPYVFGSRHFVFRANDDLTMTQIGTIEADVPDGGYFGPNLLTSTSSGYVLEASSADSTGLFGAVTFTSPDGVTWTQHDVPSQAGYQPVAWAGGLAVVDQPYDNRTGEPLGTKVALSSDGSSWSRVNLDDVIDTAPYEGIPSVNMVGGPAGLTMLVAYYPTFGVSAVPAPLDTSPDATVAAPQETISYAVFHSTDGVQWSMDTPDELKDLNGKFASVRMAGDQIIVSIQTSTDGVAPLPDQLALIATPTS